MFASGERASICIWLPLGNPVNPTGSANINSIVTTPFTVRVIPRDQHTISRRDISPNALRVLYRLRESGFGAYLVGGAVRDLLVGGRPKDFDVATDATPEQVNAAGKVFPDSADVVIVAIGDAAKIRSVMQAYGPLTEMKLTDPRFSPN